MMTQKISFRIAASQFDKFSRVKEVLIETSSGQSLRHTLQDTAASQFLSLPQAAPESWVSMKVVSVYPGMSPIVALRWFSIAWEEEL